MAVQAGDMRSPAVRCSTLMAKQQGLITRDQAMSLGATPGGIRRRTDRGEWLKLMRGVYSDAAAPRTAERNLMALCLAGGPGTFATSLSAAWLWGLGSEPQQHYLITAGTRVRRISGASIRRTTRMDASDTTSRSGIPVTTVDRTIIEAARDIDGRYLRQLLEAALRRKLTYTERIEKRLTNLGPQGRKGSGALRSCLAEISDGQPPTESELESAFLTLCRKAKLYPQRQVNLRDASFIGRVDFCFLDEMVIVEVDGRDTHTIRSDFERDRVRDARLAAQGWTVLRFTWRQVTKQSAEVTSAVKKSLSLARESRWTSF